MVMLKVKHDGSIMLPRSIFRPQDKVALIHEGDLLILKKLNPPKLSGIAKKARGVSSLSLKEVVKEIHLFRKHKRA